MRVAHRSLARLPALLPALVPALVAAVARPALHAQEPPAPATGVVIGAVHDSLAGRALAGATVQLVSVGEAHGPARTARTARDGRFLLDDVPAGRYLLGFLHPVLDSLGIEAGVRAVEVTPRDTARVDLGVPSVRGVRRLTCAAPGGRGPTSAREPPAVLIGVVRDAHDGAPVAGAVVESTWLEYDVAPRTVSRRGAGVSDTSGVDGRFALCDVPRGGSLALRARAAGDSTSTVELAVPVSGLLRRDIFLGASRIEYARVFPPGPGGNERAPAAGPDSIALLAGDGSLRGRVLAERGGKPLAGVTVGIERGPATRTSASGAWSLAGLPTGTRNLEVRRVGYYPVRIPVDVVPGAVPLEVALAEFDAMLDTVRVRASRWRLQDTGFEERRRSGAGRYLTAADLLRVPVIFTSDVFLRIPGMRVDRTTMGERRLSLRGPFGRCSPQVYLDGMRMPAFGADDIDAFVSPDEVAGIEVYGGAFVPPQFQEGLGGCGSIVIWTKPGENPASRWSLRRRVVHGVAAVALGAGIGLLFARH